MAKTDDDVMALVEDELKRNPGASVDDLFERARSVSPAVGKLSRRQFNARYPLQVKRRTGAAPAGGGGRGRRAAGRKGAAQAAAEAGAAAPRRRGRPRKNVEAAPADAAAAPRRRGRPRKDATAAAPAPAAGTGKRRGRPPRSATTTTGTGAAATGTGGGNREGVRGVFMRFANDIAGAGPKEIMRALSNLDRYVDDAIRQATR